MDDEAFKALLKNVPKEITTFGLFVAKLDVSDEVFTTLGRLFADAIGAAVEHERALCAKEAEEEAKLWDEHSGEKIVAWTVKTRIENRKWICPHCNGTGTDPNSTQACPVCQFRES